MHDAFISYAEPDGDWARVLADGLRAHGVEVFFDRCSLRPGDVVVHELETAIRQARHGIQVVGPHTMDHPWARQEYAALVAAAADRGLRLIPVLCGDAELPPFAATRAWLDLRRLTGPAFDARVAELARDLRGEAPARRPGPTPELLDAARPARAPRPGPPTTASFVVCHARQDAPYGERLVAHLGRFDLPTWSLGDLRWGEEYLDTIRRRLRHALAVVVLMSPDAEESEDVTREVLEGQRHSRAFFPVLLRGDPNYLLASSGYFDARDGALPGDEEIADLRRLHRAGAPHPSPAAPVPPPAPPVPVTPARPGAGRRAAGRPTPGRLRALLDEHATEHADLLTTALLLDAVDRLDSGWMRRADGRRLPAALLREVDEAWAGYSAGAYGFAAQRRRARVGGGRHADFMALSLGCGWRASPDLAVPTYQHFTAGAGGAGFFPTLRHPLGERYVDWYDQWAQTVLAVHLRLEDLHPQHARRHRGG